MHLRVPVALPVVSPMRPSVIFLTAEKSFPRLSSGVIYLAPVLRRSASDPDFWQRGQPADEAPKSGSTPPLCFSPPKEKPRMPFQCCSSAAPSFRLLLCISALYFRTMRIPTWFWFRSYSNTYCLVLATYLLIVTCLASFHFTLLSHPVFLGTKCKKISKSISYRNNEMNAGTLDRSFHL